MNQHLQLGQTHGIFVEPCVERKGKHQKLKDFRRVPSEFIKNIVVVGKSLSRV